MTLQRFLLYSTILAVLPVSGCLFIKPKATPPPPPTLLSPQPEIQMSDDLVRSKAGDMIAFLPKGWFFVELEGKTSSDVFAIAVNPDYTLSAVFSTLRKTEASDSVIEREGIYALARMSFARHERKSAGNVKLASKTSALKIGSREFGYFEIAGVYHPDTTTALPGVPPIYSSLKTKIAVFNSSINTYYELALVPTTISGKPLPTEDEINKIFRSILTTVQF